MSQAIPAQVQGQPVYVLKENVARRTGDEAISNTLTISAVIGEVVRSSIGPSGMNKMLVGTFGDVTYTKSGATILSEANIEHPIGKLYVDVAKTIDKNEGDGTSRAVYLASRLVARGAELQAKGIHPAVVAEGFSKSCDLCVRALEKLGVKVKPQDRTTLRDVVRTLILPAFGRSEAEVIDKCADVALGAALKATSHRAGGYELDLDDVSIVSKVGGQLPDSELIHGLIIEKEVASPAMPKAIKGAKIALIDFPLEVKKTEISTELEFDDPRTVMKLKDEERRTVEEKVEGIVKSGANVLFSQKGMDDRAVSMLSKKGILAVKNAKRSDMERLAKATGAKIVNYFGDMSKDVLGQAGSVDERKYEEERLVVVEGATKSKAVAILLRGVSKETNKEAERAIKKGLVGVKMVYEEPRAVPSGGSELVEMALNLKRRSTKVSGETSLAMEAFSEALLDVVEAMLANSGMNITRTLTELRALHAKSRGKYIGIDAVEGKLVDAKKKRILEPIKVTKTVLKSATELSSILLRIDDMLLSTKHPEPRQPQ